ncbi:hypothetical protein ENUP19_0121G0106 [Entamoeba nuttalli]|uniref:Signal recognition particle subunit SRP72 n=1 Tax=Entamoeba nuttalli TaxID=412467 RepID=A0ABQ0DIT5_9EUKA
MNFYYRIYNLLRKKIIEVIVYSQKQNDVNVFKILIISSIKLGKDVMQFEETMKQNGMNFELALAKYNIEKYDEALSLLGSEEKDKVLKAQILQKQGKFNEAAKIYTEVLETTKQPKTGILTNLAACIVSDPSIDSSLLGTKTSDYVSETYGNAALIMLRKGEITKAESYFNKALGSSALTNHVTVDNKNENQLGEDESKLKALQKRKEKRQRRRQRKMIKKHGKVDPKTIDPERWIPLYQRKKKQKKGGKK